jgi:hypothetical protein
MRFGGYERHQNEEVGTFKISYRKISRRKNAKTIYKVLAYVGWGLLLKVMPGGVIPG